MGDRIAKVIGKGAGMRLEPEKRAKDLADADNYEAMFQALQA